MNKDNNIYDILNGNLHLSNPDELLIANKIPEILTKMDEMITSNDMQLYAVDFGKDCALKSFILISAYMTLNRIVGVKVTCLGDKVGEIQAIAKEFKDEHRDDFDFWMNAMESDFSTLPIWDIKSFNQLTIPCIQEATEYIGIEEVISTYYTCIDSKNTKAWLSFLRDALLNIDVEKCTHAKPLANCITMML